MMIHNKCGCQSAAAAAAAASRSLKVFSREIGRRRNRIEATSNCTLTTRACFSTLRSNSSTNSSTNNSTNTSTTNSSTTNISTHNLLTTRSYTRKKRRNPAPKQTKSEKKIAHIKKGMKRRTQIQNATKNKERIDEIINIKPAESLKRGLKPISEIITSDKFQSKVMDNLRAFQKQAQELILPPSLLQHRPSHEQRMKKAVVMDGKWWFWNMCISLLPAVIVTGVCQYYKEEGVAYFVRMNNAERMKSQKHQPQSNLNSDQQLVTGDNKLNRSGGGGNGDTWNILGSMAAADSKGMIDKINDSTQAIFGIKLIPTLDPENAEIDSTAIIIDDDDNDNDNDDDNKGKGVGKNEKDDIHNITDNINGKDGVFYNATGVEVENNSNRKKEPVHQKKEIEELISRIKVLEKKLDLIVSSTKEASTTNLSSNAKEKNHGNNNYDNNYDYNDAPVSGIQKRRMRQTIGKDDEDEKSRIVQLQQQQQQQPHASVSSTYSSILQRSLERVNEVKNTMYGIVTIGNDEVGAVNHDNPCPKDDEIRYEMNVTKDSNNKESKVIVEQGEIDAKQNEVSDDVLSQTRVVGENSTITGDSDGTKHQSRLWRWAKTRFSRSDTK